MANAKYVPFLFFTGSLFAVATSLLFVSKKNRKETKTTDLPGSQTVNNLHIESEAKFRGLLDTACDAILIVDSAGNIEFANQAVTSCLGYKTSELLGKSVELLIPERFRENHIVHRKKYSDHPKPRMMGRNLQLFARNKNGREIPVDISLSPYQTKEGLIVTLFIRDMSQTKKLEAQQRFLYDTTAILNESLNYKERIQKIANLVVPALADCCVVHLKEGPNLVSKAFAQKTGVPEDLDAIFSRIGLQCTTENDGYYFKDQIEDSDLGKMAGNDPVFFQKLKGLRMTSWISVPMVVRGKSIGVISLVRCGPMRFDENDLDLAKLIAARAALAVDNASLYEEAKNSVRLREDILAIVSHDLKNPLHLIQGYNDILAENVRSDIEQKATDIIARSTKQMERLINDLLDFAKIQSGTLAVDLQPTFLSTVIEDAIHSLKLAAKNKNLLVETQIDRAIPLLNCDHDRLKQVFSNILGNAIKFSPEGTRIVISAHVVDSDVEVSISDQGKGIPPAYLPHLFDRYWQAKESAKLGYGLGLSIAKGIVESHGGKIWVHSESGKGSTFFVRLPLKTPTFD